MTNGEETSQYDPKEIIPKNNFIDDFYKTLYQPRVIGAEDMSANEKMRRGLQLIFSKLTEEIVEKENTIVYIRVIYRNNNEQVCDKNHQNEQQRYKKPKL